MVTEQIIRYVRLLIVFILIWIGIAFVNGIGCVKLKSNEMDPSYPSNQFQWMSPKHKGPRDLVRGDVISYRYISLGKTTQKEFGGRVIGLPGDKVRINNGDVYVNDKMLAQTFVKETNRSTGDFAEIIVPRGSVFVLADNRRGYKDTDSRGVGPIAKWAVNGRFETGFLSLFFSALKFW